MSTCSPTQEAYGGSAVDLAFCASSTLPNTGMEVVVIVLLGAALLATGVLLRRRQRRLG